jgi:hypothetical protein
MLTHMKLCAMFGNSEALDPEFWSDPFHACALAAYVEAAGTGQHHDSQHVKRLAYANYDQLRKDEGKR